MRRTNELIRGLAAVDLSETYYALIKNLLLLIFVFNVVLYILFILFQSDYPMYLDFSSHISGFYFLKIGELFWTDKWFHGFSWFAFRPFQSIIYMLIDRVLNTDILTEFKVYSLLPALFALLLLLIEPVSFVFLSMFHFSHNLFVGRIPGTLSVLSGIMAVVFLVRGLKRRGRIHLLTSVIFAVLSVLFHLTTSLITLLLYFGVLADEVLKNRRKEDLILFLIAATGVLIPFLSKYLLFSHFYGYVLDNPSPRGAKIGRVLFFVHESGEVIDLKQFRWKTLAREFVVFLSAVLGIFLSLKVLKYSPVSGIVAGVIFFSYMILDLLYTVFYNNTFLLKFIPTYHVFPSDAELLSLVAIYSIWKERAEKDDHENRYVHRTILLTILPIALASLYFPLYKVGYLYHLSWTDTGLKEKLEELRNVLQGSTIYVSDLEFSHTKYDPVVNCYTNSSFTPYIMIKYNARTPQGWVNELVPPNVREVCKKIDSHLSSGDCFRLHETLKEENAILITSNKNVERCPEGFIIAKRERLFVVK